MPTKLGATTFFRIESLELKIENDFTLSIFNFQFSITSAITEISIFTLSGRRDTWTVSRAG